MTDAVPTPPEGQDDPLKRLENEMAFTPQVLGGDRTIVETYHALTWAAATFGPDVREAFMNAVHDKFPRLAEIDRAQHDPEQFAIVHERYFSDEAEHAKSVDILAEAVTYGQRVLWEFMKAHRLTQLTLLIPLTMEPGVRLWKFGRAQEIHQEGLNVAATFWEGR